jgi:hypothetical protein
MKNLPLYLSVIFCGASGVFVSLKKIPTMESNYSLFNILDYSCFAAGAMLIYCSKVGLSIGTIKRLLLIFGTMIITSTITDMLIQREIIRL